MEQLFIGQIRKLINGTLIQGSDSLLIQDAAYYPEMMHKPNTLLFLFINQNFNWDKIRRCTPCAVITDKLIKDLKYIDNCTVIRVKNVNTAFWKFVEFYRNLFNIPIIAVTGTSGKTTTKDMIKHILRNHVKVHGTNASANGRPGHLGNLLGIDKTTEAAVFETAVGSPGDIMHSFRYFKPTIGIITNIGVTHLDGCKTEEAYIRAKGEMVTALGNEGILIVNADDENINRIGLNKFKGRLVYFGIHNPCHFHASDLEYGKYGMKFILNFQNMKYSLFVPGYGEHQVYNALAALAAIHELGIGIRQAATDLRTFKNMCAHLQPVHGIDGCTILDDTWNSNPTSLKAAIQTLNGIAQGRKRVALIGDMKALGSRAAQIHCQVGDMIAELGVDILITVGPMAELIARQALKKKFNAEIYSFPDIQGVFEFLVPILDQNTLLLVKCSSKDLPIRGLIKQLKPV